MSDNLHQPLPPGQIERKDFPRFGLGKFARRFPADVTSIAVTVGGESEREFVLSDQVDGLTRVELTADFHCVTTWSVRDVRWSGWRFRDVYEQVVVAAANPSEAVRLVVLRGGDGYCAALPLADLLSDEVLLADRLNDQPLGIEHGAPLRLVAPAHYGYKNCRPLVASELGRDAEHYRFPRPYPKFMDHPRARVALEERGRWLPAILLRYVYRLLVPATVKTFQRAMAEYRGQHDSNSKSI